MRKLICLLLTLVLCLSMVVNADPAQGNSLKQDEKKLKQLDIMNKMHDNSVKKNKEFNVAWDHKKEIPNFITGELSEAAVNNEVGAAEFLVQNKEMSKLNKAEFKLKNKDKDELGMQHFKFYQTSDDIPVFGAETIVHTNVDGKVYAVNGNIDNTVEEKQWKKLISINEKKAIKIAEDALSLDSKTQEYGNEPTAQAFIYNHEGQWMPIYYVTLQFMEPYAANMKVYINAETGKVIKTKNELFYTAATGTGTGVLGGTKTINLDYTSGYYYLRDVSRGARIQTYNGNNGSALPGSLMYDTDTVFNSTVQKAAVDAHYYAGVTYDFYKNVLGRNSYDNAGATINSTVHHRASYNNAFWNGSQMVYGDGDGTNFRALSAALDVVGHEFTHAVTERTANLQYEFQSGALNESFSDVFGYLIEGQSTDWLMGEDVYTPNISGDALRSLSNPTLYNQPAHMNDYQNLPNTEAGDWGGVHINSGIPNKAFYLAATSINNNTYMAKIYYRALTSYLGAYSQFTDARNALVQSATDLYGSAVAQKIADAFTAVGIGGTTTGDTYESNNTMSAAYGPLASGTTYNSYIYTSSDVDYYYFNTTRTGTISVTLSNLAGDYDLYLYNSAGTLVAKSEYGSTTSESINYSASSYGKFYVRVVGYNGAYSTSKAYALKVVTP